MNEEISISDSNEWAGLDVVGCVLSCAVKQGERDGNLGRFVQDNNTPPYRYSMKCWAGFTKRREILTSLALSVMQDLCKGCDATACKLCGA